MSEITRDQLKKQIHIILKDADLTVLSAKKVRLELEKVLGCELLSRKKEIDSIVMDFINAQEKDDSSEEESSDEEPQSRKRTSQSNNKKSTPAKKVKKERDSEDESGSDKSEESDYKPAKKSAPAKKKKSNGSDSDSDYVKPKAAPRKAAGGGRAKGTGFTRPIALSPQLAELMGAESLPRHEVVKKMWSIIKEKNLYCPKNKQFAICDEALYKVMGVKRFRTFGMLKYLKSHFVN